MVVFGSSWAWALTWITLAIKTMSVETMKAECFILEQSHFLFEV